jgi:PfaB family protein
MATPEQKIAVVGMAVKYAGAKNKDEFWKTLNERTLNTKPISEKRLKSEDKSFHMAKERSKYADKFNNDRYGVIPEEEGIRSEHDLLLKLAQDAMADYNNSATVESSRCGIVSGCLSFPREILQDEFHDKVYQPHFESYLGDVIKGTTERGGQGSPEDAKKFEVDPASYVAKKMNLGGTHYSLDAACASALYVLKCASDHLLNGSADVMMAGASTFPEPFFILTGFSTFQALPLGGDKSVPLDVDSKGLTPGEGGAIMVLKRYEDAVRDNDKIYGTLLGVGLSNAGTGLPLKPHQPSQVTCLEDTYKKIGVSPSTIQYVECHATGTVQGDKAEVEAMKHCFRAEGCPRYGSTKGNFGHTLVSAGFAGMCKVLLSMRHGVIPGTPGVERAVDKNLVVENTKWPDVPNDGLKRAGLSAFGFGGTNAHAVFEEYRGNPVASRTPARGQRNRAAITPSRDVPLEINIKRTYGADRGGQKVTLYEVTISTKGGEISKLGKRFSEFQSFKDALLGQGFALSALQKFPSSGGFGSFLNRLSPQVIDQRRTELEGWLQSACSNANIRRSGLFRSFLSLDSEPEDGAKPKRTSPNKQPLASGNASAELAIVGMEARFGTLKNLQEFERAIFEGEDASNPLPEKRWRFLTNDPAFLKTIGFEKKPNGCFIDDVDVDYSRLRTPLTKEDQLIPQQLLAISVMDQALVDAGFSKGGKVAVLVGLGTELELYRHRERLSLREQAKPDIDEKKLAEATDYVNNAGTSTSYVSFIGNLVATRLSSMWGFTGPSFTITEGENSSLRCLEVAKGLLASGEIDAAVIGGVDLNGSAESFYVKSKQTKLSSSDKPCAAFEHRSDGLFIGEGAGAIVLKRAAEVNGSTTRVYAKISGVGTGRNAKDSSRNALFDAGLEDSKPVEYIELSASFDTKENDRTVQDLSSVYKGANKIENFSSNNERQVSVGCVQANVGHVGYASGMAALIKTSLCLHNRYLPVTPRWEKPRDTATWENSTFYVCPDSRAWMKNPGQKRYAAVNSVSNTGSHFHLILSDAGDNASPSMDNLCSLDPLSPKLLKIIGDSPQDVLSKVTNLSAKRFADGSDEEKAAAFQKLLGKSVKHVSAPRDYVLSIIASASTLSSELGLAVKGLSRSIKLKRDWLSPSGSFFTASPLRSNKVAFMYGDGASPYCGLGRDLYRICPSMHEIVHDKTTSMWSTSDEAWNTREVLQSQMKHAEDKFVHRTVDMFRSGVFHSTMFTTLAKDILGIAPKAAFGLSMGEVATLFAFSNANSKQSAEMTKRLNSSPVWTKELAVEFNALRKAWNITNPDTETRSFWRGYLIHASRTKIEKVLKSYEFVRLVIVNDARSCIIAGKPEECSKFAKEIDAYMNEIPQGMVGHCDFVKPHADAIQYVHDMLAVPDLRSSGTTLYTGVGCKPMPLVKGKELGNHVAQIYSEIADFEKLVRKVYQDGHDVFIELGADSHRANAVKNILNGKPHVAVSIDRRGERLWTQILKMCAVLTSHGVAVDIAKLYHPDILAASAPRKRLQRLITLNGRFGSMRPATPAKKRKGTRSTGEPSMDDDRQKTSREKMIAYRNYQLMKTEEYKKTGGPIVFDYMDLLEFAEGKIGNVFGPEYSIIDTYGRRVMLPMEEYLLCTRVTHVKNVKRGRFNKCTMITEYDIPINGPHSDGGDVPWAILVESGQCDLMLISMLGIDFQCKGERVYRLLNTTLTFYGVAKEGETLVYDIKIDDYANRPDGKGISMFFFHYDCYVNGKLLIEMRGGCAGFFTDEELAAGKGIVYTKAVLKSRSKIKKKSIKPYLIEPATKTSFNQQDMAGLVNRKWGQVVGPTAQELNYKLVARKMLMIDRVTHIFPSGGAYGLGLIIGEKILERDHWYFPCHFKGDQVMAGSLVSDGCSQMLKLYMVWLGLHKCTESLAFRPVPGQPNKVRCRGQISPHKGKLVYVMEIKEIGFDPETGFPFCKADVDIIDIDFEKGQSFSYEDLDSFGRGDMNKKIVVDFKGIALQIEGAPSARNPVLGKSVKSGAAAALGRRAPLPINPPPNCLNTNPAAPNALVWHPMAGKNGNPTPFFQATAYPPRPITFAPFPNNPNDNNHVPGELPLSWVNMCEFMCGRTSACLGQEFKRFDNSKTSRSPAFDLQVVTRVLSVTNLERGKFYNVDVNPSKGTMVAEFDVPEDAWFFKANSRDDLMPYSILMEIGLQTSGILTSWVKAPLTMDKDDILFRNLDATAELLKHVDLRGKTIINTSHVVSYSMLGNMGVHKFTFDLATKEDGVFYKGETSFGWFVPEVFENQVGLDGGKRVEPWHIVQGLGAAAGLIKYDMTREMDRQRLFSKASGEQLLRRSKQVEFLDTIEVIPMSGIHKKGYLRGQKTVNKGDWFFSCHFWCDPVMPGSLGIESMYQLMEAFCIHSGVGSTMKQRCFEHDLGKVSWKYRGQLTPRNDKMDAEVHIKSIKSVGNSIIVIADGFLYVDSLRVYSTKSMRLRVQDVGAAQSAAPSNIARLQAPAAPRVAAPRRGPFQQGPRRFGNETLRQSLLNLDEPVFINNSNSGLEVTQQEPSNYREFAEIHMCTPKVLGDPGFMEMYGVDYPLYTGAMAKGIASAELVVALGKRRILASLGAGGLPLHLVNKALDIIQAELPDGPYAVNLIHSPFDDGLERGNVDLFLKRGVTIAEASAFMTLTIHVVRYRVAGLSMRNGKVHCKNKIIAKVSRTELADMFMRPAPEKFLKKLLASGEITQEQARLAKLVPMSDDIAVESDSGGHTDNRPIHVILPLIMALRDRIQKELKYPTPVRVGVGGGIGCPAAMAGAFQMGAAFVITGSVNQIARQSGSSDLVRKELAKAAYSDVTMAPAADMFDQGVKLQVLKKGTMFPSRAAKLWSLFCKYNSLEEIPPKEFARLEKKTLSRTVEEVWKETTNFYINRLHDEAKIKRAETDPKLKMSLVFRWYLSKSSGWANRGEKDRRLDFQIWCGPAMGAYNQFVKGSYLDPAVSGVYPDAVQINLQLLTGCSYLQRIQQIRNHPRLRTLKVDNIAEYRPEKEL